jgi:nitrate/TMAO reductase-like tetraheme cytochrome c subunit
MTVLQTPRSGWREWLSPIIYLSNNWLSFTGVLLVTMSTVFWLFLLPTTLHGEVSHPYLGILIFLLLPGLFFLGLALIPAGIYWRRRRERSRHIFPESFAQFDLHNISLRRLLWFLLLATVANIIIASQLSYSAVNYMDSVTFCGLTCHTVMAPEYSAYQGSPHSRVECVQCHIGPGASWFVKSKLSGTWQVIAVMFNLYPRPIPAPVQSLRPARETCEACHWPQRFGGDRLRVVPKYADDEGNTLTKSVLLMHIGGGGRGPGIHGVHVAEGVDIEYAATDEKRQNIAWVRYRDAAGKATEYFAPGVKPEDVAKLPVRTMDCIDCHNRPTHAFDLPERALDRVLASGELDPSLPFAKKTGAGILKAAYASREEAAQAIPAAFERFYREKYPQVYAAKHDAVVRGAKAVLAIYQRNIFPQMRVTWGTYNNNIGHNDFPGCFRCHDDEHASKEGKKVSQDCNSCHNLLAMDEASPKILTDLGLQ